MAPNATASAGSSNNNVSLGGLVDQYSEQNAKASGPFEALFKELGMISIVFEVVAMYGINVAVYAVVKSVRMLFKDWSKNMYRPRMMPQYWVTRCLQVTQYGFFQSILNCHEPLFSGPYSSWSEHQITRMQELTLDGLVYILFTRACVQMLACWAVAAVFLLNIDYTYNLEKNPSIADISIFGTSANCTIALNAENATDSSVDHCQDGLLKYMTVKGVEGPTLYWHVANVYMNLLIAFFVIFQYFRLVNRLRTIYLSGGAEPKSLQERFAKESEKSSLSSGNTQRNRRWIMILGDHEKAMSELTVPCDAVEGESLRIDGIGNIISEAEDFNEDVTDLEVAMHEIALSFKKQVYDAQRWVKIREHLDRIKASPMRTVQSWKLPIKPAHYRYLCFEDNDLARVAHYKLRAQIPHALPREEAMLCPDTKDILWSNIGFLVTGLVSAKRMAFEKVSTVLSVIFIVVYGLTMVALSFLSSLDAWVAVFPGVKKLAGLTYRGFPIGNGLTVLLTSLLPGILATAFRFILPIAVRVLVNLQRPSKYSDRERTIVLFLVACLLFVNLFLFTSSNILFRFVSKLISPKSTRQALSAAGSVPDQLVSNYIEASNYWTSWLPATVFGTLLAHLQFARLFRTFRLKWRSREATPRERRENFGPDNAYQLAERCSNFFLMVAVACLYSPLCPFVPIVAAPACFFESLLTEADMTHLYVYNGDGGGVLWPTLINCLLFCCCGIQIATLLAVIGIADRLALLASMPLVLISGLFWIHLVYDIRYLVASVETRKKYRFNAMLESFEWGGHAGNFYNLLLKFEREGAKTTVTKRAKSKKWFGSSKSQKSSKMTLSEQDRLGIPSYRSSLSERLFDVTVSAKTAYAFTVWNGGQFSASQTQGKAAWKDAFNTDKGSILCVEWPQKVSDTLQEKAGEICSFALLVSTVKVYDGRAD